jgi:hypothetical protein
LVIAYREVTYEGSENLTLMEGPFLHAGNLSIPAFCIPKPLHPLEICAQKNGFQQCFDDGTGRVRSMIVKIHGEGSYSFPAWLDGIDGRFVASDGSANFSVELNDSFFSVLLFGPPPPTCQFAASEQFGMTVNEAIRSEDFGLTAESVPSEYFIVSIGSVSEELGTSWSGQVSQQLGKSLIAAVSKQFGKTAHSTVSKQFEMTEKRGMRSDKVRSRVVFSISERFKCSVGSISNEFRMIEKEQFWSAKIKCSLGSLATRRATFSLDFRGGSLCSETKIGRSCFDRVSGLLGESPPLISTGVLLAALELRESTQSVWIGAGSVFAVILIAIGLIVFMACRRRSLSAEAYVTESEKETDGGGEISREGFDIFVSEENALSSNARLSGHRWKAPWGNAAE